MDAKKLYKQMEKDFITPAMNDDWFNYMAVVKEYISDNFVKRSMGLVCDFTDRIDKVYTAVFPTPEVMRKILKDDAGNSMLFVHHPAVWDITKAPQVFQQMDADLLKRFKDRKISIYNLHVPLDNYGPYSTSVALANALDISSKKSFGPYNGGMCGVLGKTKFSRVKDLYKRFEDAIGHKASLYNYGPQTIRDGRVAIVAGGGNSIDLLEEIVKSGATTFVTGITALNPHSQDAHEFARKHKINILGGTHYSTEKFACIAMVNYFRKHGLESEFVEGKPGLKDL